MTRELDLAAVKEPPPAASVLEAQGIPPGSEVPRRVVEVLRQAGRLYTELAEPRGLWGEIDRAAFERVYRGEGLNELRTPIDEIAPRSDHLALFVATLGEGLSRKIGRLFACNEPALGYMLDAVASERADMAAGLVAKAYLDWLRESGRATEATRVLPYSPGYCGWHITGQRALFRRLAPDRVGVTLNESCLMQPLKSVSGVLVAGRGEIHRFENDFDFCGHCTTHGCRGRISALAGGEAG